MLDTEVTPQDRATIERLYADYTAAVCAADVAWLERNLADDYTVVTTVLGPGATLDKREAILLWGGMEHASIEVVQLEISVLGPIATVLFAADVLERFAPLDTLDDAGRAVRAKLPVDDLDMADAASRNLYGNVLRRRGDGWEIVVHSWYGLLDEEAA